MSHFVFTEFTPLLLSLSPFLWCVHDMIFISDTIVAC